MKIKIEQEMKQFCDEVNSTIAPFYVERIRTITPGEVKSRLREILVSEPIEKVSKFQNAGKEKELYIQGIKDISHRKNYVTVDEIPVIYPSSRAKNLEGPMTGVLVNCYIPDKDSFLFHMRGKDVSTPFGFQGSAAGFIDFGDTAYQTAADELKSESSIETESLQNYFHGKSLAILPFMKNGYPQPLFLYGFEIGSAQSSRELPALNSMEEIEEFERKTKDEISKTGKIQEAYPFVVSGNHVEDIVRTIYNRDPSQQGKNGGFFGPIKESYDFFIKYLTQK